MLHENPSMIDIDIDQWRNLHVRFLESTRKKRRIIVIHEDGHILRFVHSAGEEIERPVGRVTHAREDARKVYEANRERAEFVMLLERRAVERFFAQVQDSWRPDQDLDEYIYCMYCRMDDYPDGIVTWPGPPARSLGLRWKLPFGYAEVEAFVRGIVPASSVTVIAVFEEQGDLWASLVLGFDPDGKIDLISSVDRSVVQGGWKENSRRIVDWVEKKFWSCSFGVFTDREGLDLLLEKGRLLRRAASLIGQGRLIIDPMPPAVRQQLAWLRLPSIS